MRLRSVIACAGLAPLLIAAAQPVRLQPSSPWVIDYAENSCRLVRTFGEGKMLTKLGFESDAPDDVDMLVTGRPLSTSQEKVPARFLPVGVETYDGTAAKTIKGSEPAILWGHVEMLPDDVRKRLKDEEKSYRAASVRPPRDEPCCTSCAQADARTVLGRCDRSRNPARTSPVRHSRDGLAWRGHEGL